MQPHTRHAEAGKYEHGGTRLLYHRLTYRCCSGVANPTMLNAADLGRLCIQWLATHELSNGATEAPVRLRCAPLTGPRARGSLASVAMRHPCLEDVRRRE